MGILPIPRTHKAFKRKKVKEPLPTLPIGEDLEGIKRLSSA